jgi:hypothetical protein
VDKSSVNSGEQKKPSSASITAEPSQKSQANASIVAAAQPAGTGDSKGEAVWVAYRDVTDGAVYYHNRCADNT